jgi:hypothetical protein
LRGCSVGTPSVCDRCVEGRLGSPRAPGGDGMAQERAAWRGRIGAYLSPPADSNYGESATSDREGACGDGIQSLVIQRYGQTRSEMGMKHWPWRDGIRHFFSPQQAKGGRYITVPGAPAIRSALRCYLNSLSQHDSSWRALRRPEQKLLCG